MNKIPIDVLHLSPKILNTLKKAKIETIEDLESLSERELYLLKGIKDKAIQEIKTALNDFDKNSYINVNSQVQNKFPVENELENRNVLKNKGEEDLEYQKKYEEYISFDINNELSKIENFIENFLNEKEKLVLKKRLINSQSLQEIGESLGITRERVRQVENKILKKIVNSINLTFFSKKEIFVINKKSIDKDKVLFLKILEKIYNKYLHLNIFESKNIVLITKWDKNKIQEIKNEVKNLLFEKGIPLEIERIEKELKENNKNFLEFVLEDLGAVIENNQILFYKKLNKPIIAELILRAINKPMHFNEIRKIYIKLTKEDITPHNIESILQRNENVLMVERGTFFLKDKIYESLGEVLINQIKNKSYEILEEIGKPSDTVFLLNKLKEDIDLPEIVNPYLLKSILKEDKRFQIGRKFEIWLKEFNIEERIEYESLILEILENSDVPLSIKDIQEKLKNIGREIPYVTINMVFIRSSKIVRVEEACYSTLKKLNINTEDINLFKNIAFKILKEFKFPTSLEYISEQIKKENQKYNFLNEHILYSIFKNFDEFQIVADKLLMINNFEYSFKTYADIIEYILEKEGQPVKVKDLLEKYKNLTKDFSLKVNSFYNYLYSNSIKKNFFTEDGIVFLKRWKKEDFSEELIQVKKSKRRSSINKNIREYLFYKEYSLSSFDPKKEKDKIEEYKNIAKKYNNNEPTEREKIEWLKYLVEHKKPIEILKLIKYINVYNLTDEEKDYLNKVKEMFY